MVNKKFKVFISSVQKEFEAERTALEHYLRSDVLLKSFFDPFLFEKTSATNQPPEMVFLDEISRTDIYIGIFGKMYGYEDSEGISPTEKEYSAARNKGIPCWIYILKTAEKRHEKEEKLIQKVSNEVSWKFFSGIRSLEKEVYYTCIEFLKQKGRIDNNDFDSSLHDYAVYEDVNRNLLQEFIEIAYEKRNYPEKVNAPVPDVLKRLNLTRNSKIANSALLLFSANPQQFFPSATVKCAHFHGVVVQKPIPDYKEFGGTIFEMTDKAVDFILSKINLSTGTRDNTNLVDTHYEIPRAVIAEAVINALAHRDYYSKGSVQVSVFSDRIEIENPGRLPNEITVDDLKKVHASYPHNPILAYCLFLTGAIERFGTGTLEMINKIRSGGLVEPIFISGNTFKVILWRKKRVDVSEAQYGEQVREQVREQVEEQVILIVSQLNGQLSAAEIMEVLSLKGRRNFIQNYLQPALESGFVEMTQPDSPKSPTQKYRLTPKGMQLQTQQRERNHVR